MPRIVKISAEKTELILKIRKNLPPHRFAFAGRSQSKTIAPSIFNPISSEIVLEKNIQRGVARQFYSWFHQAKKCDGKFRRA
jgi:hypothetical protein